MKTFMVIVISIENPKFVIQRRICWKISL